MTEQDPIMLLEKPFDIFDVGEDYRNAKYFRVVHKETGNWASFGHAGECFVVSGYLKNQTDGVHVSGYPIKDGRKTMLLGKVPHSDTFIVPNWEKLADKVEAYINTLPPRAAKFYGTVDPSVIARSWPVLFSFMRTLDGQIESKDIPFLFKAH